MDKGSAAHLFSNPAIKVIRVGRERLLARRSPPGIPERAQFANRSESIVRPAAFDRSIDQSARSIVGVITGARRSLVHFGATH